MNPIAIISQAVAAGGLTGARPVLTLFLLQSYAYFVEETLLPEGLEWIINPYTIGVFAALSVVEHFIRTDPDFEELMKIPNNIIGTTVAMMTAFLIVHMSADPAVTEDVVGLYDSAVSFAGAGSSGGQSGVLTVSIVLAVLMSMGISYVRSRLIEAFEAFAVPSKWWRWIETGGVMGLVTVIVLMPFAAVALALTMVLSSIIAGVVLSIIQRSHEKRHRCPCPECGAEIRIEATTCPHCRAHVEPSVEMNAPPHSDGLSPAA